MKHKWKELPTKLPSHRCERCGLVRQSARVPRKNGLGVCDGWRYTDSSGSWLMHATDGTPPCAEAKT